MIDDPHTTITAGLFADLIHALDDRIVKPDITAREAFAAFEKLLTLMHMIHHLGAVLVGTMDRLGVATNQGRRLRELLICSGLAPSAASRLIRLGTADDLKALQRLTSDGALSGEHADAIVRGLSHIAARSPEPLPTDLRAKHATSLTALALAGMNPADISAHARQLGNDIAADTDGSIPTAENRSINSLALITTSDGRLRLDADLDMVVGEKLSTAVEALSTPVTQPDGSPDPRSADRRRADAFEILIDAAVDAITDGTASLTTRFDVLMTLCADNPTGSSLQYMGPMTEHLATTLSCDSTISLAIVDDEQVPLNVGRKKRLFTAGQRKALLHRDQCCIKCGAPPSRTQAHHIVHWAHGGTTDVSNGALLCTSCHHDVHDRGWDVIMSADGHPWLIPPATVDPARRPLPAYNRRTMRLDNAA